MALLTRRIDSPVVQIHLDSGKVPHSALLLADMEYLERSIHRMLCAWGNQFLTWEDKQALSRHVWEQAEVVRRLRERIDQFPGIKAGAPVSKRLETLTNIVLLAPSFEDAVDGIYQMLSTAVVMAYHHFLQSVHPIHDAPTHAIIAEIVTIKQTHRAWLRDYRRRNTHQTDQQYVQAVHQQLAELGQLREAIPVADASAECVGVNTTFRPLAPRVDPSWMIDPSEDLMAYIIHDFSQNIETRRLFWMIGYMRELNLAIDQLQWLYDSPYMPWKFHHDESRHMWDESRHGDSGYSRMKDFGLRIEDIGFTYIQDDNRLPEASPYPLAPTPLPVMSPQQLYEAVFTTGMIAETGHFKVKREAYADFRDGGDLASAEMMLYDIIDETAHVQYVKHWLGPLAEHAGIDDSDYERRAAGLRAQRQAGIHKIIEQALTLPRESGHTQYDRYQHYLQTMRAQCPLSNAQSCPPRSPVPM